ncbi:NAD-dependent epimerase/dehydratase family protein [Haloferula rosea]|uniref:Sugar nucleotide-binding protein n=1 Tax=Haloferula rosea TaxID=490093 RepID=A0A934RDD1_9BACT|nr:NAD-dependent epimerase/dehydratase family protein [Haloferula rosea]MBK1826350.1 sugar nucleotide-binding protein [Haloferula rosea]
MHLLLCGHGYLGQAISRDFLQAGWSVTAVSRTDDDPTPPHPQLDTHATDISSQEDVDSLKRLSTRPDFIVHCAASGRGGPDAYRAVYRDGCRNLVTAFPDTPLLFTSSTSVYAQTDGSIVTEESPADPDRETGRLLRDAEQIVLDAKGIVFRLAGIYGPYRSAILKKFLAGDSTLEEDGRRFINQIHRDDAAAAVVHAATCPLASGIYNVSDSHPRSQFDTFKSLSKQFDIPFPPSVPRDLNRKRGWTHKQVSNAKLLATGWIPEHPDALEAAPAIASTLLGGEG